jgi:hypothetical protein
MHSMNMQLVIMAKMKSHRKRWGGIRLMRILLRKVIGFGGTSGGIWHWPTFGI